MQLGHFGKFFLIDQIGEGGMGKVFLAKTKSATGINKTVAIKIMNPNYAAQTVMREMFKHEAKLAILLRHNCIASIQEFGISNGRCYVAMDYVPGVNLLKLCERANASGIGLSPEEILYVARGAASGLEYVHRFTHPETNEALNIVHRDLSP